MHPRPQFSSPSANLATLPTIITRGAAVPLMHARLCVQEHERKREREREGGNASAFFLPPFLTLFWAPLPIVRHPREEEEEEEKEEEEESLFVRAVKERYSSRKCIEYYCLNANNDTEISC